MSRIGQPWVWIAAIVLVAGLLRLSGLTHRPMHTDEAVHAAKLGQLLDHGTYRFDPNEYHGPILNVLTWPIAALRGQRRYADLDEVTLRLVPALCGLCLVLLPLVLLRDLGWQATLLAMAFTAVSPGLVFYSRYYIQEILLVLFTFGLIACAWRYLQSRTVLWAVLAGVCVGLMHATKETSLIAWACLALAGILTWLWSRGQPGQEGPGAVRRAHLVVALVTAILVSAMLYSSFLSNPKGIVDSLGTLAVYAERASSGRHIHPWHYYLDLLTWIRFWERPRWHEDFVVIMAAVGLVLVTRRPTRTCDPRLARFLTLYTLAMTVVYSAIPYKTPWCMLGFLHGMVLVSAIAVAEVASVLQSPRTHAVGWAAVLVLGVASPLGQAYELGFRHDSDPDNPYVYAHTSRDIFSVVEKVREVAAVHRQGKGLYVQVVCPQDDYWPLPWYLRDFTAVGYWSKVDLNVPPGDVILARPEVEPDLVKLLYDVPAPGTKSLYVPLLRPGTRLRPGVELRGYVRKDLWDAMSGPGR